MFLNSVHLLVDNSEGWPSVFWKDPPRKQGPLMEFEKLLTEFIVIIHLPGGKLLLLNIHHEREDYEIPETAETVPPAEYDDRSRVKIEFDYDDDGTKEWVMRIDFELHEIDIKDNKDVYITVEWMCLEDVHQHLYQSSSTTNRLQELETENKYLKELIDRPDGFGAKYGYHKALGILDKLLG